MFFSSSVVFKTSPIVFHEMDFFAKTKVLCTIEMTDISNISKTIDPEALLIKDHLLCQQQERRGRSHAKLSMTLRCSLVFIHLIPFPTVERSAVADMDSVLDNPKHHGP